MMPKSVKAGGYVAKSFCGLGLRFLKKGVKGVPIGKKNWWLGHVFSKNCGGRVYVATKLW